MSHFHAIYADKCTTLPGVGRIHSQTVGNTSHTTGIDHYFLAEGAEKQIPGFVRFACTVADDGTIGWRFLGAEGPVSRKRDYRAPRLDEATQVDFPAEVVAEMRRLSETLDERHPTDWLFSVMGAVDMGVDRLLAERHEHERTIRHLGEMLANPAEPKQTFLGKGLGFRPSTAEERTEIRTMWQGRIDRAEAKIVEFDAARGPRLATLRTMQKAITAWCSDRRRTKPRAFLANALKAAELQPA